jgi:hypothetical protein
MFSDLRDFDYEPPTMQYDKKTGDIKIIEGGKGAQAAGKAAAKSTKKVIGNVDDLEKERAALFKELGLDEQGYSNNPKEPIDKYADKIKAAEEALRGNKGSVVPPPAPVKAAPAAPAKKK